MNFMYLKNLVIVVTIINFNVLNLREKKKKKNKISFHVHFDISTTLSSTFFRKQDKSSK